MTFELKLNWVQIEWNLILKIIQIEIGKNGIQINVKGNKFFSCDYGARFKK